MTLDKRCCQFSAGDGRIIARETASSVNKLGQTLLTSHQDVNTIYNSNFELTAIIARSRVLNDDVEIANWTLLGGESCDSDDGDWSRIVHVV